jgi:UDP-N-acetylmuramate dehydrogenase
MIKKNFPLKDFNTFGLDYKADHFVSLHSEDDVRKLLINTDLIQKPNFILGGGSNILFTGDFRGTILHPEYDDIAIEEKDSEYVIVSAWAGTNWDNLVDWSVKNGFCGMENLSLIPGSIGATPVQNIGAYGREVKDIISKVKAINIHDGSERVFTNKECKFGYRESIFKKEEKRNYLITRVYYKLNINQIYTLNYGSLEDEVKGIGEVNLKNIRQAVIKIRKEKLPDPHLTGNAGSFFKNPVVDVTFSNDLKYKYPDIPLYNDPSGNLKLAAGWMIEKCGWKGKRIGDAGVHEKQALVIVNYGNATGKEIYELSESIKRSVYETFGINLEREVEVIGSI